MFLSETLFSYKSAGFDCLGYGNSIQDSTANKLCFLKSFSKNSSAFAKDEVREKKSIPCQCKTKLKPPYNHLMRCSSPAVLWNRYLKFGSVS